MDNHTLETQASSVTAIIDIAKEANEAQIVTITTKHLNDTGLPSEIPLLYKPSLEQLTPIADVLNHYRETPKNRTGIANVSNLESFISLTTRHKDDDSVIFADSNMPAPFLMAVIDYHTTERKANNLAHKILYKFPITKEYNAWLNMDSEPMSQEEFAEFLEIRVPELASATQEEIKLYSKYFNNQRFAEPTELLQLAKQLDINVSNKVTNGQNLATGEKTIIFTEEQTNTKGQALDVPSLFMVSVPAFVDGAYIRIPTRLRFKVRGGTIKWTYLMFRPEDFLKEQVKKDLALAATSTGLPTFEGNPER